MFLSSPHQSMSSINAGTGLSHIYILSEWIKACKAFGCGAEEDYIKGTHEDNRQSDMVMFGVSEKNTGPRPDLPDSYWSCAIRQVTSPLQAFVF